MDITFHYFAIKTLALKAGFEEREAQRIATYSQYIDDYNWISYIDCKNLPDRIKAPQYDLYVPSVLTLNTNFNPVMTGFIGCVDMAFLLKHSSQKFIVSPFHFIPEYRDGISADSRTTAALVGDGSIIGDEMVRARDLLLKAQPNERDFCLMRIGMLLHTFADTYAHQLFSGYSSWVNEVKILKVTDNITGLDIVGDSVAVSKKWWEDLFNGVIPKIGHALAGHVPDLTNVSFEMSYKANKDDANLTKRHIRSNTQLFVKASKIILNFLRTCRNLTHLTEADWDPIAQKLSEAFLFVFPTKETETKLAAHWGRVFPGYNYVYSKKNVEAGFYLAKNSAQQANLNSIFGTNYTQEFYVYNCLADELLINMYGDHPRNN